MITLRDFKSEDIHYSSIIPNNNGKIETANYIYIITEKDQETYNLSVGYKNQVTYTDE